MQRKFTLLIHKYLTASRQYIFGRM